MSRILKRSHMCGVLNASDIGEKVVLNGWIAKSRRFKDLVFCDLRDKTGIVQLVFDSSREDEELFEKAESLRSEYVVGIRGRIFPQEMWKFSWMKWKFTVRQRLLRYILRMMITLKKR